jgi:hypothetical protein
MKTIDELEPLIWLVATAIFMIMYAVFQNDAFILFSMTCVIMVRISILEKHIKQ